MTCRDFQRQWDELLDAEPRTPAIAIESDLTSNAHDSLLGFADFEGALIAHAANCPDCRRLGDGYRVLRHAARAWRRPPLPSSDLVDRILIAAEVASPSGSTAPSAVRRKRIWPLVVSMASIAAAACIVVLPAISRSLRPGRVGGLQGPPSVAALNPNANVPSPSGPDQGPGDQSRLDRALSEARSATWDLALSASEPAARISRDALGATLRSQTFEAEPRPDGTPGAGHIDLEADGLAVSVPSLAPLAPDPYAATAALQQVGDHLANGVRPLSDTARHAFGFLMGPVRDQAGARRRPTSAKGA